MQVEAGEVEKEKLPDGCITTSEASCFKAPGQPAPKRKKDKAPPARGAKKIRTELDKDFCGVRKHPGVVKAADSTNPIEITRETGQWLFGSQATQLVMPKLCSLFYYHFHRDNRQQFILLTSKHR